MMFTVLVFIRLEKQYREAKYGKPYECRIFGGASQVYSRIRNMANVDKKYTLYGDLVPELIDRGLALP